MKKKQKQKHYIIQEQNFLEYDGNEPDFEILKDSDDECIVDFLNPVDNEIIIDKRNEEINNNYSFLKKRLDDSNIQYYIDELIEESYISE